MVEQVTKNNKLKIASLLSDLKSDNSAKIKLAIEGLEVYGNESVIEPILEIVSHKKSGNGLDEIGEFLSSLKSTKAIEKIMNCLHNPDFKEQQNFILSTIWNSPLDYSHYLSDFVKIAVKEDFMHALECLTVIENMDGPFQEKDILESQLHLKDYHEGKFLKDKQKDHLISEIAILIKDFDRLVD